MEEKILNHIWDFHHWCFFTVVYASWYYMLHVIISETALICWTNAWLIWLLHWMDVTCRGILKMVTTTVAVKNKIISQFPSWCPYSEIPNRQGGWWGEWWGRGVGEIYIVRWSTRHVAETSDWELLETDSLWHPIREKQRPPVKNSEVSCISGNSLYQWHMRKNQWWLRWNPSSSEV